MIGFDAKPHVLNNSKLSNLNDVCSTPAILRETSEGSSFPFRRQPRAAASRCAFRFGTMDFLDLLGSVLVERIPGGEEYHPKEPALF